METLFTEQQKNELKKHISFKKTKNIIKMFYKGVKQVVPCFEAIGNKITCYHAEDWMLSALKSKYKKYEVVNAGSRRVII